jgi:hypothetical protein
MLCDPLHNVMLMPYLLASVSPHTSGMPHSPQPPHLVHGVTHRKRKGEKEGAKGVRKAGVCMNPKTWRPEMTARPQLCDPPSPRLRRMTTIAHTSKSKAWFDLADVPGMGRDLRDPVDLTVACYATFVFPSRSNEVLSKGLLCCISPVSCLHRHACCYRLQTMGLWTHWRR